MASDFLAGIAYVAVAFNVFVILQKTKIRFGSMLTLFTTFLAVRGLVYFAEVYTDANSAPAMNATLKFAVAVGVSGVALWLFKLQPEIIALSNIDDLLKLRTAELEKLTAELESRVEERTRELMFTKMQANSATEAKSQFLTNMSHEIRTPLSAISGFSELLLGRDLTALERIDAVKTVHRNSVHLSNLVTEILDLSKIEAGELNLEIVSFEPGEILEYVMSVLNFKAIEKNLYIKVSIDPDVPRFIRTDPTRLRQVLTNIVGNAVKFTEQGSVDVNVSASQSEVTPGNSRIHFRVRDTGIGISPDKRESLFDPFSQSDNSMTRKFGGTGLGLALSKKLARALGGDVTLVESSEGAGSEFLITIDGGPACDNSRLSTSEPFERSKKTLDAGICSFHGIRILAVDDSPDNRDLIRAILKPSGATVSVAADGLEAVDLAMAEEFDIVLMDVQMPRLDGHAATRRLRERGYRKPIIALTAHALREDRNRAFAAGFDDHLTKPIQRSSLFDVIGQHVKKVETTANA